MKRDARETCARIRSLVAARYFRRDWHSIIAAEVANRTGFDRSRVIDMMVADTAGVFTAVEIKISLGDLRRELENPEKWEAWNWVDHFMLATTSGVWRKVEQGVVRLPSSWGVLVMYRHVEVYLGRLGEHHSHESWRLLNPVKGRRLPTALDVKGNTIYHTLTRAILNGRGYRPDRQ